MGVETTEVTLVKPTHFDYRCPKTLDEAIASLHDLGPGAKILAGGQSLVPLMNFRLATPEYLVDINGIAELQESSRRNGTLRLGAMTRQKELDRRPDIEQLCPLLVEASRYIAHPQIRTRGTLGGSLAHADPSAELPAAAVALDATIVAQSVRGERTIRAENFFTFHFTTALEEDELLTAIDFPIAAERQGSAFLEVAARSGDFAAVGATSVLDLDGSGRIQRARVVCSSVAPTPVRISEAEAILVGTTPDAEVLAELEAAVTRSLDPSSELKVSAAYKRRTAGVLARRTVQQAWEMAQGRAA